MEKTRVVVPDDQMIARGYFEQAIAASNRVRIDAMRPGVLAAVAVAALGLAALAASKLRRLRKRPAHAKR